MRTIEWKTGISVQPNAELKIGELVANLKLKGTIVTPRLLEDIDRCQALRFQWRQVSRKLQVEGYSFSGPRPQACSAARKVPMAAPSGDDDDGFFVKLKRADPKVLEERQKAVNERVHATFEKSQQRLAELLDQNSTLPTTISSITVLGAPNTRRGFLERIFNPLLSVNRDRPYTQSEVLREVSIQAQKLSRFGM